MAKEEKNPIQENIQKTLLAYMKALKEVDRDKENFAISAPYLKKINLPDPFKWNIKFISTKDMRKIKKLERDQNLEDADMQYAICGLKEWNWKNEKGEMVPIKKDTLEELPDFLFNIIVTSIKGKNREPGAEELENFILS